VVLLDQGIETSNPLQARGLLFGRTLRYPATQLDALWSVVRSRTERSGIPVLADVDLGHADPMLTMPMGRGRTSTRRRGPSGCSSPRPAPELARCS